MTRAILCSRACEAETTLESLLRDMTCETTPHFFLQNSNITEEFRTQGPKLYNALLASIKAFKSIQF